MFTFLPEGCLLGPILGTLRRLCLLGGGFLILCAHPNSSQDMGLFRGKSRFRGVNVFPGGHFFFSWTPLQWAPWGQALSWVCSSLYAITLKTLITVVHDEWMQKASRNGTHSLGLIQLSVYEPGTALSSRSPLVKLTYSWYLVSALGPELFKIHLTDIFYSLLPLIHNAVSLD